MRTDRVVMRAVRLEGPGLAPRVERLPVPRRREGEALLRVLAAGVCHTELQLLDGTLNPGVWPLTPGHEIVGEVVDGPTDLMRQKALVYYSRPCGECEWCARGQEQVCPNAGPQPGLSTDGGFAEYVCVPVDSLVPLAAGMDAVAAAPLGCAAATAYHALHAVACVEPGETIVVFGVGGGGLPLIELGVLRGARVVAVGRSPSKLALARELGAETVDASAGDPALGVRRLTGGQGPHAVFELVASDESMPAALAMPRRRGRLVLVGYGSARLRINPLELVLRETQLLSSLGNTRAELREVVALAARGALRVPIAGEYALEDVPGVLEALRAGQLVGRAVVVPGSASRLSRSETSPLPVGETARSAGDGAPIERMSVLVRNPHPHPLPEGEGVRPLEAELLAFVGRGVDGPRDDAEFNDLALRLFAYQVANNRPYRLLAERRGRTPATVSHWREIPAVPIAAFKEPLPAAEPIDGAVEFNPSGPPRPEHKSRHFHPDLSLYNLNAQLNFQAHVLPDRDGMRLLVLFPPRHELP